MSKIIHIDDRPYSEYTEEERRKKAEEAERILGPERYKQIQEEFAAWKKKRDEERKKQEKMNEFVPSASFKITYGQLEKIRPYLPNVDELLNDIREFQCELDDAIVFQLGDNYEDTDVSLMLQIIYDEIYDQNKK